MRVVFFGAGNNLKRFLKESPVVSYITVQGILDNDESKWGEMLGQYTVESPDKLLEIDYDRVVVTAYYKEIREQLLYEYKLDEVKIIKLEWLIVPGIFNVGDIDFNCRYEQCYSISDLIPDKIITHNRLEDFFFHEKHNPIRKWWHYFEVYHQFFMKFVGSNVTMLEIGVYKGGSLQMWKDYFGDKAVIVGIDIDESCQQYTQDQIRVHIGSQNDVEFLKIICERYGPFDIVLDDGSHFMEDQIKTFETLFPMMAEGGVYICEDTHTSYWSLFQGALQDETTFIEYSKRLVDDLNGQHVKKEYEKYQTKFWGILKALHFYDSMIVAEKKKTGFVIESEEGFSKRDEALFAERRF